VPTPRPWTVLPHGPVVSLAANLRSVEGTLPTGHVPRRMAVARRSDGRLIFYNAIPLDPEEMAALEAWGTPSFLLVPNPFHRLDLHAFKERYPGIQVLCTASIRAQVSKVVAVGGDLGNLPPDPDIEAVVARGTQEREVLLRVRSGGETSLCFSDLVMNLKHLAGFDGFLLGLLGSVGGPRVTRIAKMVLVKDRAAVRAHLDELASIPGLARLIPSHGDVIEADAAGVLRGIAAKLA
jgi:hypothetical protein